MGFKTIDRVVVPGEKLPDWGEGFMCVTAGRGETLEVVTIFTDGSTNLKKPTHLSMCYRAVQYTSRRGVDGPAARA